MDRINGTITIDANWLREYYPETLEHWLKEKKKREGMKMKNHIKRLTEIQWFLDNDTSDDKKSLALKQAIRFAIEVSLETNKPSYREEMWQSIVSLSKGLENYPQDKVEKEEEE